nr:immunoglobulin heavy chain junction region [Mus musculus]
CASQFFYDYDHYYVMDYW